jgi:hypothetical protein
VLALTHIAVDVTLELSVGAADMVMVFVMLSEPEALVTFNLMVYVPAVLKVKEAFWVVAEVGVPPEHVHTKLVGLFVDVFVQLTVSPEQAEVADVKFAVGTDDAPVGVILPVR